MHKLIPKSFVKFYSQSQKNEHSVRYHFLQNKQFFMKYYRLRYMNIYNLVMFTPLTNEKIKNKNITEITVFTDNLIRPVEITHNSY